MTKLAEHVRARLTRLVKVSVPQSSCFLLCGHRKQNLSSRRNFTPLRLGDRRTSVLTLSCSFCVTHPPPQLRVSSSTFCPLGCGAARRKCCGSDWQNITNIRREREPGRALPKSVLNSSFPRRLSLHMSD